MKAREFAKQLAEEYKRQQQVKGKWDRLAWWFDALLPIVLCVILFLAFWLGLNNPFWLNLR